RLRSLRHGEDVVVLREGNVLESEAGASVFGKADEAVDRVATVEKEAEKIPSLLLRKVAVDLAAEVGTIFENESLHRPQNARVGPFGIDLDVFQLRDLGGISLPQPSFGMDRLHFDLESMGMAPAAQSAQFAAVAET